MTLHAIILAAGQGTRMHSARPKVLHAVAGLPMLGHVLTAAQQVPVAAAHVVLGHGADAVRAWLEGWHGGSPDGSVSVVVQDRQLGTAHAVRQALPEVPDAALVVVLYGDVPLVSAGTIRALAAAATDGLALVTAVVEQPGGYGRILRDSTGGVCGIVEEKDATSAQRELREINTGLMAAPAARLRRWVEAIGNANASGEYYLTDAVALAVRDGVPVRAVAAASAEEVDGVNDAAQLARAERRCQRAQAERLMHEGVQFADPARFDLRGQLHCGRDVRIDVGCVFEGDVRLGDGVSVGPHVVLRDVVVGDGTRIDAHSVLERAEVGAGCAIGPFARLRPGATLGTGVHIGNFVEIKNSRLGAGAKANHLAYVGDADVGARTNIGAGVITCNYDGAHKHRTVIGEDVFIGSDTQLVAPVSVGDRAYVAAGSTIARDAPADALTVNRARSQHSVPGWQRPKK